MKALTTLFALAIFCATACGQTIKALGYDTASGEVVANTGTNVLTFTNLLVAFDSVLNPKGLTVNGTNIFETGINLEGGFFVDDNDTNNTNAVFIFQGDAEDQLRANARRDLGIPLPALTNTSNADMLSALGAAQTIAKWKSVAQSVTNSTTLIDDDTLFFATEANARYYVRLYLMAEGVAGQTGTHSFVVTATNATVYGTWRATGGTFGTTPLTTETSFNLGAANPRAFYVNFTVEGGASPGEVKLQWAQGTATTNASSVSEGSVLIAEKLP
jgi:hypothetical protein